MNDMISASNKTRLELAQNRLALYLKAEKAILSGQSYEVEGLKLTRANLKDVQDMIADLESVISKLTALGRKHTRVIVPRDGW